MKTLYNCENNAENNDFFLAAVQEGIEADKAAFDAREELKAVMDPMWDSERIFTEMLYENM